MRHPLSEHMSEGDPALRIDTILRTSAPRPMERCHHEGTRPLKARGASGPLAFANESKHGRGLASQYIVA